MNNASAPIHEFINDFHLKQSNGVIAFKASILFMWTAFTQTEDCSVHIITSNNLMTVYLLGDNIESQTLPDMFSPAHYQFSYASKESLKITGKNSDGPFTVSIFPKKQQDLDFS